MVEVEIDRIAGGKADAAACGGDGAAVLDLRGDEGDEAAVEGIDGALIDYRTGTAGIEEVVLAVEEVGVGNTQRGGDQTADIDLRAGGEQYAAGIGDEDVAVGSHAAEDGGSVAAHDAVEDYGRGAGLGEIDVRLAADVEGIPIDDGAAGGLIDVHARAAGADADLPGGDLAVGGQRGG